MKVSEILNSIDRIIPYGLAEKWDNSGLQIGNLSSEINKILLTLDVTNNAIDYAVKNNCNLIISHHPLIFNAIKTISNPIYIRLIKHDISVISLHTNLDFIYNGVNKALADKLALTNLEYISNNTGAELYQIAVYCPVENAEEIADKACEAGAGKIGNYDRCFSRYEVSGKFRSLSDSSPSIGELDKIIDVSEMKLELFVDSFNLNSVIKTIKKYHPYETRAIAVYPQGKENETYGLGFIGETKNKYSLREFGEIVKERLCCPVVKLWTADKGENFQVKKVAVCGGSGSSLLRNVHGRADVFVSADFNYHTILDSRMPIIDAGHFYTEYPVLENLSFMLRDFGLEIIILPMYDHEINNLYYL
ncbi:MAG: Nif3-like dinuclear metal center hexameric protein [Candidatus Cloacimonetes bacterium]|nr:Nif3-like dinuclear metal center hexameric protein [Candidatus Cloacimonadota bacterium]